MEDDRHSDEEGAFGEAVAYLAEQVALQAGGNEVRVL